MTSWKRPPVAGSSRASSKIGGVRRDISSEKLDLMVKDLEVLDREMKDLTTVFLHDDSIRHRLRNVGVISREDAYHLGAVGPTARGSGVAIDMRKLGYGAYDRLNVQVVTDRLRGLLLAVRCQGKGALYLNRSHPAGCEEDPRRAHRCQGDREHRMGSISCGPSSPGENWSTTSRVMAPSSS